MQFEKQILWKHLKINDQSRFDPAFMSRKLHFNINKIGNFIFSDDLIKKMFVGTDNAYFHLESCVQSEVNTHFEFAQHFQQIADS